MKTDKDSFFLMETFTFALIVIFSKLTKQKSTYCRSSYRRTNYKTSKESALLNFTGEAKDRRQKTCIIEIKLDFF